VEYCPQFAAAFLFPDHPAVSREKRIVPEVDARLGLDDGL
jgi:hypothetical protein